MGCWQAVLSAAVYQATRDVAELYDREISAWRREEGPMATLHHARIDNTCCPMCGRGIEPQMREVLLRTGDGSVVAVRVDSHRCARQAQERPDAVAEAARVNQIAH